MSTRRAIGRWTSWTHWAAATAAGAMALAAGSPALGREDAGRKTAKAPTRQLVLANKSLDRQLEALVERSKLGPVNLGVCVVDCATGDVAAALNAKAPLIPASNMKLLTSGTAVLVLGKDFEFKTKVVRDEDRLVVIGGGDPGFADPELLKQMKVGVGAFMDRLVESAQKAGVTGVREVIVDERIFDRQATHPTWPTDQLNRWYCAEVSGLNFHSNILQIFPTAGDRPGPAPMPRIEPSAGWIEITNTLQTVATGSTAVGAVREGETRFKVMGSIRATLLEPVDVTVRNPALVFAHLLADRVGTAGMGWSGVGGGPEAGAGGEAKVGFRLAEPGDNFDNGETLAIVRTPIATALKRCNTDSYNLYAEAMIKRVGHDVTGQPGSWGNGATVIRMQITEKVGQEAGELVIADGSGMSRDNRVTALTMAMWLGAIARTPEAETFIGSLASPGEGTLEKRFRGRKMSGKVHAKSGFLNGVQCLSGYVDNPASGRRAAFSVLVNNITAQTPGGKVKEFHEEVVELVDQWLSGGGKADQLGG